MHDTKNLDDLVTKELFRMPEYQRGYAWQADQLGAFWEDLTNVPVHRYGYTGVVTRSP